MCEETWVRKIRECYYRALEWQPMLENQRTWRRGRFERGIRLSREIEVHLDSLTDCDVLELGMAHGGDTAAFVARGARMTGMDFRDYGMRPLINCLGDLCNVQCFVGDLNASLPLKSGSFDGIIALSVLEHVNNLDQLYEECARVLRRPGWMVVFTGLAFPSLHKDPLWKLPGVSILPMRLRKIVAERILRRNFPLPLNNYSFYSSWMVVRQALRYGFTYAPHKFQDSPIMQRTVRWPIHGFWHAILREIASDYIILTIT